MLSDGNAVSQRHPFYFFYGGSAQDRCFPHRAAPAQPYRNCSLARFVRKRLKRRGVDIGKIVCVSSDEQVNLPATALFDDNENDANPVVSGGRNGRKRLTMGSLPTVTAIFGLTIAGEIIKNISRRADSER